MQQIVPNLWINDGKIEEAVDFYCSLFEDSRIVSTSDYGRRARATLPAQTMAIYFELQGQTYVAINGGDTRFEANESVSLAVPCDTQDEIDRLWDALTDGGEPGPCGWLKDRYGFSWQVYPTVLDTMMVRPRPGEGAARHGLLHGHRQAGLRHRGARGGLRGPLTVTPALPSTPGDMDVGGATFDGFPPRRGTREADTAHSQILRHRGCSQPTWRPKCLEPV